jgi:Uma2 family endonuclease
MAETEFHRDLMTDLIDTLKDWFATDPTAYVSGNLLLFYEEGNKRRHVSPDVFVVFGVSKRKRLNYLLWEEGHGPAVVIELTSSSTRREDTRQKLDLYRDVLRVPEYFLFDPFGDYLSPQLQGHRLVGREYRPIRPTGGRLRSRQLRLWLEPDGQDLRFVNPQNGERLLTKSEARRAAEDARRAAEDARRAAEDARRAAEDTRRAAEDARRAEAEARQEAEQRADAEVAERQRVQAELERLRAELAALRKRPNGRNGH